MDKLSKILDPMSIFTMSDAEVASVAAEKEESRTAREELGAKLKILKSGSEICKKFAALYADCKARTCLVSDVAYIF